MTSRRETPPMFLARAHDFLLDHKLHVEYVGAVADTHYAGVDNFKDMFYDV